MSDSSGRPRFATRVIHAGQTPDPATGAIMPPIYATSTYVQSSPGVHRGYEYARTHNPTRQAYERCVADLENGTAAYALSRALRPGTRMVWVETPTNPLLKIVDLERVARIARDHGLIAVVDNTFATPWAQRPLDLGFDLVLHSATKYLNGHSDVVGGVVVVGNRPELAERLAFLQNAVGAIAGPFDSFLVLRGVKTLDLRMRRHCENALAVARWLEGHPAVERVIYPGLPSHPQHALARRQMSGFGGMVTATLRGGLERARRTLERCRVFALAESLGGVESLVEHPAIMTHASIPAELRRERGIGDGMIRLSVGIEDTRDLIDDLEYALGGE